MEITNPATPKGERVWKGRCRECKSEAQARENEMKNIQHDYREGGSFSWEVCPVCGAGDVTGYGGMLFYPVKDVE